MLSAEVDLSPLKQLRGEIDFNLREFRRISSDSIQAWLDLIRSLRGASKIRLLECPSQFVQQANAISNLLRREADIAVRMLRPAQGSLVAKKLGEMPLVVAAHERYLQRAGTPRQPTDLFGHTLIGFDRDDGILRGFAAMGYPVAREQFALRTDDQIAYGRLVAEGAGIGFVAAYAAQQWPGVKPLLPMLKIPPLPVWLAVHREIRGNRVVKRVYDFLAEAIPRELQRTAVT